MILSHLTTALNARLVGTDASFNGVSIDSRSVSAGQLFVALTGPRFDGHDYLADVKAKGAVAALVEREIADVELPQLVVADARLALGQLGALNRAEFDKTSWRSPVPVARPRSRKCWRLSCVRVGWYMRPVAT